jgi:hypothetical protein
MTHGIYPKDYAAILVKRAGEKWRPCNGTEGDLFIAAHCMKCMEDGDNCEILHLTFAHDVEDAEYPAEWQYGVDGQPTCTAFRPEDGEPVTQVRCAHTVDMFAPLILGFDLAHHSDISAVVVYCPHSVTNLDGICVECGKVVSE